MADTDPADQARKIAAGLGRRARSALRETQRDDSVPWDWNPRGFDELLVAGLVEKVDFMGRRACAKVLSLGDAVVAVLGEVDRG